MTFDLERFLDSIPRPGPTQREFHNASEAYKRGEAEPYQEHILLEAAKQLAEGESDELRR